MVLLFRKFALETADKYNMPEPVELTEAAKIKLKSYPWPGNIRQLKNITEQLSVLLREERVVTPEVLQQYVPDSPLSYDLIPVGNRDEQHSFENEREILYKILFDLRNDVTELKKLVHSQHAERVTSTASVPMAPDATVSYIHPAINVPAPRTLKADEDFIQDPEEYVEESLSLNDWERQMIIKALEKNRGKRKGAAKDLNISERTLYRKIKEYGLDKENR